MINHNRVIKTTIFVVFLFVILSLPIFNKSGTVSNFGPKSVSAFENKYCTEQSLKDHQNETRMICHALQRRAFYRTSWAGTVSWKEIDCDKDEIKDLAKTLSAPIGNMCFPYGGPLEGGLDDQKKLICEWCQDDEILDSSVATEYTIEIGRAHV